MNVFDVQKTETLCRLLVAAALLRGELAFLEDGAEEDTDFHVAISCAITTSQNLEIQIINTITSF